MKKKLVREMGDSAYHCPNCGSYNCELNDADDLNFFDLNQYDGATVDTEFMCKDCDKPYTVQFELKVKDVYPSSSDYYQESKKLVKEGWNKGELLKSAIEAAKEARVLLT